jgi:hypothetical protein
MSTGEAAIALRMITSREWVNDDSTLEIQSYLRDYDRVIFTGVRVRTNGCEASYDIRCGNGTCADG